MNTIINLLLFIFILGLLVFIHELGHFLAAKKSNVHIHEFSIGMGPLIKSFVGKKDGIQYSIRALPIGGYVQMAGEIYEDDDTKKIPKERFMCNRPWYQRLIVLAAGVFNNFMLAIVILFVIALIWGAQSLKPVIYDVTEGKPVAEAGIVAGDKIISINGSKVSTWDKAQLLFLFKNKSNTYSIGIEHKDGSKDIYKIEPNIKKDKKGNETKEFGFMIKPTVKKGFIPSLKYAFSKFFSVIEQMWLTIVNLFTGRISINSLSGPVGIYTVVGESRSAGISSVLFLIAYLSINLGVVNILPIPALDGGHILFLVIEMITGKKMNEKVESIITIIFFALLLLLMLYITVHDIFRIILK